MTRHEVLKQMRGMSDAERVDYLLDLLCPPSAPWTAALREMGARSGTAAELIWRFSRAPGGFLHHETIAASGSGEDAYNRSSAAVIKRAKEGIARANWPVTFQAVYGHGFYMIVTDQDFKFPWERDTAPGGTG